MNTPRTILHDFHPASTVDLALGDGIGEEVEIEIPFRFWISVGMEMADYMVIFESFIEDDGDVFCVFLLDRVE